MNPFSKLLQNSLSNSVATQVKGGEFFIYLHHYDLELSYQLKVSSRRKTLALELSRGKVTVRTPPWLSLEDIESFILAKQDWLMDKLQNQQHQAPVCQYQDGDNILYLGQRYQLQLMPGRQFFQHLDEQAQSLTLYIPNRVKDRSSYVKNKLKAFYLERAQSHIGERFEQLEQHTGLKAKAMELKFFKSRWGCCYSSGLVRLNPMLMGAPNWVIDCVIIHELCHLTHMNHSAEFWQLNAQFCDHCQPTKAWLKDKSSSLYLP